ncbi:MAG: CRISPR-associated endonuclease Cas1 [Acidobacteria bacterium]|nr:CRISPR-associated endonuclease Cas1 [Acidobacteriota bacterium]
MESPDQIPARMLNEYTYCPRLFYLEYVQQEWAHTADTLDGRYVHRRVDQEQGGMPAASDLNNQVKLHSRSVLIGSDQLGAVARIDLIETDGGKAIPVDYKRGSPPDIAEGAWEPERVQLCLQGLLLRENGYECDYGILYFAAAQARVTVDFTEELITRTLALLDEARHVAASGVIPPPLVDSPKCPRCSLVGICLPDEINLLRATAPAEGRAPQLTEISPRATSVPRRLVAARDDRLAVYVQGQGFSVGLKGEALEIRDKGKVVDEARLLDTAQVNLFGNVQLSAQALRELAARDIAVMHLSYGGWLAAVTTPPPHKNIELRRRQFQSAEDPDVCLRLARAIVAGKIRNARTLLRRNARELPDGVLHRLAEARRRAERAVMIEQLLGIEGTAAREYFAHFAQMFKPSEDTEAPAFELESRNRRPPRDPVNALLSFLYAMLVKDMVATLVGVGFDPYLGFYHQPRYGRPALALDLMEEFRPLVADSVAVGMINNGELRRSDFIARAGAVALTDSGRRRVIEAYERRMDTMVTHPKFGYAISYRRIFEVQARLLSRFLMGEIAAYPPFCTR